VDLSKSAGSISGLKSAFFMHGSKAVDLLKSPKLGALNLSIKTASSSLSKVASPSKSVLTPNFLDPVNGGVECTNLTVGYVTGDVGSWSKLDESKRSCSATQLRKANGSSSHEVSCKQWMTVELTLDWLSLFILRNESFHIHQWLLLANYISGVVTFVPVFAGLI